MATTPQNLLKQSDTSVTGLPITAYNSTTGNVVHSGDMVYVDTPGIGTSTFAAIALDTDTHALAFAGICMDTYDPTNYGIYSNDPPPLNGVNIQRDGLWYPYTTSGETYFPGNQVFIGANAQTISRAGGGTSAHSVGYVSNPVSDPNGVNYQTGLVGVGTNQVLCYILTQWPSTLV